MFFILSKILFILIVPYWWIIFLLVWRFFAKSVRVKKRLGITIILLIIIFTNQFLYKSANLQWQPEPTILPKNQQFELGIMLGGASGYDKFNKGHFGLAADRFIQITNLYHQSVIKKILITGGTGRLIQNEPPETDFIYTQLIANGIPDSVILLENRSRNTYENAIFSKKITDSLHLQGPFLLVTSAQHMPRSVRVFKKAGFNFVPYPCDYRISEEKLYLDDYLVPDISLLKEWSYLIKEAVGLCVYKLTGKA